ncbi:hypothetical protein [Streptomyces sp. NPDC058385]|uniref:hypothetical protein n=1 Tax=Streptomyces sp. NPDC058385 TaxID=3346473 RepID=UPI003656853C
MNGFPLTARKAVMTKHGARVDALRMRSVEAAGERADVRDRVRCLQPGAPDDPAPLSKHPCTTDEPSPAEAEFCTFLLRLGRLTCPGDHRATATGASSAAVALPSGATVTAHSPHPFEVGPVTITVAGRPDVASL